MLIPVPLKVIEAEQPAPGTVANAPLFRCTSVGVPGTAVSDRRVVLLDARDRLRMIAPSRPATAVLVWRSMISVSRYELRILSRQSG